MIVKTMEAENEENNGMDDIQYFLHLESLKRYTEEAKDVHRQVEDHVRIFSDAKREYKREFIRLTDMNKHVMLCNALQAKNTHINTHTQVERTASELSQAINKIASDNRPSKLDVHVLEECKKHLQTKHKQPRDKLTKHQLNVATNREILQALCTAVDNVEKSFETATLVAMDQFTNELQVATHENEE